MPTLSNQPLQMVHSGVVDLRKFALLVALPIVGIAIGIAALALAPADPQSTAIVESRPGSIWDSVAMQEEHYVEVLSLDHPPIQVAEGITVTANGRGSDDSFFEVVVTAGTEDEAEATLDRLLLWLHEDSELTNRGPDEIDWETWEDALEIATAELNSLESEAATVPDDAEKQAELQALRLRAAELRSRVDDAELRLARIESTVAAVSRGTGSDRPSALFAALIGGGLGLIAALTLLLPGRRRAADA